MGIFGMALLGVRLRKILSDRRVTEDSKDTVLVERGAAVFHEKPWPSRAVGRILERLGREAHLRLGLCVGDEPAPIGCQNRNTTSRPTVQPVMFEPHTYDEPIPIHWTFQS